MRIETSALSLATAHHQARRVELHERLDVRRGVAPAAPRMAADDVQISEAGRTQAAAGGETAASTPQLELLRRLIETLTGRSLRLFDANCLDSSGETETARVRESPTMESGASWGLRYDAMQRYEESEQLEFAAEGIVRTRDGREIRFSVQFSLSRQYVEETGLSLRLGSEARRKDPLVLNLAGTAAELGDQPFVFDLDADGQTERLASLRGGSGFLAFDRNADGTINNGHELFGARTGDGFAELAALDADRNGWIDESDAAYEQLSIWRPGASDELQSLRDADVGAIALQNLATPFAYRDAGNMARADLRASGAYLRESGGAGTIQQLDFVV